MLKNLYQILFLTFTLSFSLITKAQTSDISRSFGTVHGISIVDQSDGPLIWYGGGVLNPSVFPGVKAPIGSVYRNTMGEVYSKIGNLDWDWVLDGQVSPVFTQVVNFGKKGNSTAGAALESVAGLASDIVGPIILVGFGQLKSMGCTQKLSATYTVSLYYHDGNNVNPVLLYTLPVTASTGNTQHNLNITIPQGKQLKAVTDSSVSDIICTLSLKGVSI